MKQNIQKQINLALQKFIFFKQLHPYPLLVKSCSGDNNILLYDEISATELYPARKPDDLVYQDQMIIWKKNTTGVVLYFEAVGAAFFTSRFSKAVCNDHW